MFSSERTFFRGDFGNDARTIGTGNMEARLKELKDEINTKSQFGVPHYVYESISNWVVYHFHDTSDSALVRKPGAINLVDRLAPDASNLAAFLSSLSQREVRTYQKIVDTVRLACPFFQDFVLKPMPSNAEFIRLEWQQVGSEYPLLASQLSDGTLRFICLVTALLQPHAPTMVLFDEPELGLHPYAITVLASLLRQGTKSFSGVPRKQVIVSTQSAALVDYFSPEEVIVTERMKEESVFRKLNADSLDTWLQEYSLGELWQKNLLGGRPGRIAEEKSFAKAGV